MTFWEGGEQHFFDAATHDRGGKDDAQGSPDIGDRSPPAVASASGADS